MKSSTVWIILIVSALFTSCEVNSPTPSQAATPLLTASKTNVNVALNNSYYITVGGGNGPYVISSNSDSTVIRAALGSQIGSNEAGELQELMLTGLKIGSAKIVVKDSAQQLQVEISIIVAVMVASESSIKVKVNRYKYITLSGGLYPYTIAQNANAAIAQITFNTNSNFVDIKGVSVGSTNIVFKDNSQPSNSASVAIEVIAEQKYTTAGTFSFASSSGNFSVSGIAAREFDEAPANTEGAGGSVINRFSSTSSFIYLYGYKKKAFNIVDVVVMYISKKQFSAGLLPVSDKIYRTDSATVLYVFDGNLDSDIADVNVLSSGNVILSTLNAQKAVGTFSGNGYLMRGEDIVPGVAVSLTNGAFDVPIIVEDDLALVNQTPEVKRINSFVERIIRQYHQRGKNTLIK